MTNILGKNEGEFLSSEEERDDEVKKILVAWRSKKNLNWLEEIDLFFVYKTSYYNKNDIIN